MNEAVIITVNIYRRSYFRLPITSVSKIIECHFKLRLRVLTTPLTWLSCLSMHAVIYTEGQLYLPSVTALKDGNTAISDSSVGVILRKWPGI
jgi:hypothetical protein